jgi:glycosyltransferase involved in cell wall biosynthesis
MMQLMIGLITPGQAGGIRATEERFIAECTRRGARVTVFEYGARSSREKIHQKLLGRCADWIRYGGLVRRERPDIVHINSALTHNALLRDIGYAAISRLTGSRLFVKMHGTDVAVLTDDHPLWRSALRFIIRGACGIGLLSSEERRNFLQAGMDEEKLFVVKNVVNYQKFTRAGGRQTLPGAPLRLLFIARFIPEKGLMDVLDAVRIVLDRGKNVCLDCVGDGPQGSAVREHAAAIGITDRVRFTGYIPEADTTRHYTEADVLVFPTYHQEGFPMTVFQSAAAGLGIITTRVRAAADYLTEPDHCLWVEPRNPAMLAEKITDLVDHPDLLQRMAGNNQKLAKRFSTEIVTGEYLTLFANILDKERQTTC